MWLKKSFFCGGKTTMFFLLALVLRLKVVHSDLVISPPGPTWVNAEAGTNVTLAVSFSGAEDPVVRWSMGSLPVVTWKVGSDTPPDVSAKHNDVLKIETNGSLTLINVQPSYSNNYTVEITKSGLGIAQTTFILKVYEHIGHVTLSVAPGEVVEGSDRFSLLCSSSVGGEATQWSWFFNGVQLNTSLRISVERKMLVVRQPDRRDAGRYALRLENPFSHVKAYQEVTVLYGPDEPVLMAVPSKPFYEIGDSLRLSCEAEGLPQPSADWMFGGRRLPGSLHGVINLTDVQTAQGGIYTCLSHNEKTGASQQKNRSIHIYNRPRGDPECSVHSMDNNHLQYRCKWPEGVPNAHLAFPILSNSSAGDGELNLTVAVSEELDGKTIVCRAKHPVLQNSCNVTARKPCEFRPSMTATVESDGRIAVTIRCLSPAMPPAVVTWIRSGQAVTNGTMYQISTDTTQFVIRHFYISSSLLGRYTCFCYNPLGSKTKETQLLGPTISDSSLFPNRNGTVVTLTWEVPPLSVVTGFDVQMKGPNLFSLNGSQSRQDSDGFRSIQMRPGSARSANLFVLNPKSTYRFRVVPRAGRTVGEPSGEHRIGPGDGLGGAAIAGIAAGIPCGLLVIFIAIFYFSISYCRKRRGGGQSRYPPVSRAVEKVVTTQTDTTLPDYNKLQAPSEMSLAIPTFVPPPPVRFATTV